MEEKSTDSLMRILKSAKEADLTQYCETYLAPCCKSFVVYMDEIIAGKGMKRQDIFQKADIPWKYGYKLLSGEAHTKDRDKLLRLFFAMGLSLKEAQRALELYGMPALYPKNPRDAVLIIALNRGIDSVDTVNEWLRGHGQAELTRSPE